MFSKILLILILISLISCNSANIKKDDKKVKKEIVKEEIIEMETVLVSNKKEELKTISELFKEANLLVVEKKYNDALDRYNYLKKIVSEEEKNLVLYNIAVIYGKMKEYEKALNLYFEILEKKDLRKDFSIDVIINVTEIYGFTKSWKNINSLMEKYFKDYSFENNGWDYVELTIRYEVALFNLELYDDVEFLFMRLNQRLKKNKHLLSYLGRKQRYFLSMGYFFAGEVNRIRFEKIPLNGNRKKISNILDEKSELILTAQKYYLKSIFYVDKYWATASGYRIGEMYDKFYNQIVKMKIPNRLTFEEKVIYKEELKIRIQNLLKKAIQIFQSNIDISEKTSENNIWIKKSLKRLKKAKKKYLEIKKIELENS